jgi:hypothetical protein
VTWECSGRLPASSVPPFSSWQQTTKMQHTQAAKEDHHPSIPTRETTQRRRKGERAHSSRKSRTPFQTQQREEEKQERRSKGRRQEERRWTPGQRDAQGVGQTAAGGRMPRNENEAEEQARCTCSSRKPAAVGAHGPLPSHAAARCLLHTLKLGHQLLEGLCAEALRALDGQA